MPVCTVCKADEFDSTEDGGLVCKECGTQVKGIVEEVQDTSTNKWTGVRVRATPRPTDAAALAPVKLVWPDAARVFGATARLRRPGTRQRRLEQRRERRREHWSAAAGIVPTRHAV